MLQKVVRSTVIDAPIERVWEVLRDFNSHDQWHEVVEESRIEAGRHASQVGCVRAFRLKDGNFIREQLLTLDDRDYRSTYCIVESTVPLQRYVASVTLKPVTDGNRTFWHWESSFSTPPGEERRLRDLVATGVYEAGFENLRRHLRRGGDLRSPVSVAMPSAVALSCRCVRVESYGGPQSLVVSEGVVPAPAEGEVRIQQRAIGVNFLDVYLRRGWIPSLMPLPGTPGMEAAGSVLEVGEGVGGLMPGDRVAYLGPTPGAYVSLRNVPADTVVRLPAAIDDEVAAALLLKGITADYLLRDLGRVFPGQRWLVHAAAGGVGLILCAWARALGARVIGTVSSESKARIARDAGCEEVVVAPHYQFSRAVLRAFGEGADVIVDGLGEQAREENFASLAMGGHWISLGQASGGLRPIDPDWLLGRSATFSRPVVFAYTQPRARLAERAERVWQALSQGHIRPPLIERHSLENASRAHERLESRQTTGALVLLV